MPTVTVTVPTTGPASLTQAEIERVFREFDGLDRQCAGILLGDPSCQRMCIDEQQAAHLVWGIVRWWRQEG